MGKLSCSGWCSFDKMGLPGVLTSAGLAAQPGYGSAAVSTKAASASPILHTPSGSIKVVFLF